MNTQFLCGLNMATGLLFSFKMSAAHEAFQIKVHTESYQHLNCLWLYIVCATFKHPPTPRLGTIEWAQQGRGIKATDPSVNSKANMRDKDKDVR